MIINSAVLWLHYFKINKINFQKIKCEDKKVNYGFTLKVQKLIKQTYSIKQNAEDMLWSPTKAAE